MAMSYHPGPMARLFYRQNFVVERPLADVDRAVQHCFPQWPRVREGLFVSHNGPMDTTTISLVARGDSTDVTYERTVDMGAQSLPVPATALRWAWKSLFKGWHKTICRYLDGHDTHHPERGL
jgi:hypothetical protein